MKSNAEAVLTVVESIEKLRNEVISPEQAAALSVAIYGAPPKPPATNVATLISERRRVVEDDVLVNDVVLSMSVARYGLENNRNRAESAANNICRIMEGITSTPSITTKTKPYVDTLNEIFVRLNDDNSPRVDCSKYKLVGTDKNVTAASFKEKSVLDQVVSSLKDILSKVDDNYHRNVGGLQSYVNALANNNSSMNAIVSWADTVENALKKQQQQQLAGGGGGGGVGDNCFCGSRYTLKVNIALKEIMRLVGQSYCKTVSQLTSVQDLNNFEKATDTCFKALMADTHERIICTLLFYVSFKNIIRDEKEYVKKRLGTLAGTTCEPDEIERRTAAETLFGLCFMFKMLPPEFVDSILTFPSGDLSYHGRSGTRLSPLLSNYGPPFEEPWARFKDVLAERSKVVRTMQNKARRIDSIDAIANLTGSMYVLILDVANAFQAQRTSADKFLNEIKEQYKLWNKFVKE